jgi:hypothetical protein
MNTDDNNEAIIKLCDATQKLYKHVGEHNLNYWGFSDHGEILCCLGCLRCGHTMYSFKDFQKNGPKIGNNIYFCNECRVLWQKNVFELKRLGATRDELTECNKPRDDLIDKIKKEISEEILKEAQSKEWYYID